MHVRTAVAAAIVAFVVGAGAGAFAVGQSLSGDSVRAQAAIVEAGETFTVGDAAFDRSRVDVPGYSMSFQLTTPALYSATYDEWRVELTDADGCDSPPPIGTLLQVRHYLKTPGGRGTSTPLETLLVETGSYSLFGAFSGAQSGLGQYDCDSLTFTAEGGWVANERHPLA